MSDDRADDPLPGEGISSPRLAAALAGGDADAIGRALRHDIVLVPLVSGADGATQVRVVEGSGDGLDLPLFSSSGALTAYLADDPSRTFDVQRGAALAAFLTEHRDRLSRVVFDPAGPHPVAAPVEAVLDALRPQADDDEVEWITEVPTTPPSAEGTPPPPPPARRVRDFRLAVPFLGWTRIVPADLIAYPDRAAAPIVRAARRLTPADREAAGSWLAAHAIAAAAEPGVREVSVSARGRGGDARAVMLVRRWMPAVGAPGADHAATLRRVEAHLGPDDEFLPFDGGTPWGAAVSHAHRAADPTLPAGGAEMLDFWLPFPDGWGTCRIRFLGLPADRQALRDVANPIVAGGDWVL